MARGGVSDGIPVAVHDEGSGGCHVDKKKKTHKKTFLTSITQIYSFNKNAENRSARLRVLNVAGITRIGENLFTSNWILRIIAYIEEFSTSPMFRAKIADFE